MHGLYSIRILHLWQRASNYCNYLPARNKSLIPKFMLHILLLFWGKCHVFNSLLLFIWQHDSGTECTPGESKTSDMKERGNYIMYARATSGDKLNNNKFSICSIRNISQVLDKKRALCFVGKNFLHIASLRAPNGINVKGIDQPHKVILSPDVVSQPCLVVCSILLFFFSGAMTVMRLRSNITSLASCRYLCMPNICRFVSNTGFFSVSYLLLWFLTQFDTLKYNRKLLC